MKNPFYFIAIQTVFFFLQGTTLSSGQKIEWQRTIGGSDEDYLVSCKPTTDGGFIVGGWSYSNSSGDKTENSMGSNDYWIIKLDLAGNIQWQNTIGGSSNDFLQSVYPTNDGGYICGGFSGSNISGDKTENCKGGYDFWIVKLNDTGNILWQKTIGGSSDDNLLSILQISDGGYICGGMSSSGISGDKTEGNIGLSGERDYWIVKLDSIGNIQWQNTIGGTGTDYFQEISQSVDGGYICCGYSDSDPSSDKSEGHADWDYWVVKIDPMGSLQWENTLIGANSEYYPAIDGTTDGGSIIGGYSNSNISFDKTENSLGFYDYWIIKLDSTGNIEWQNTIGGGFNDILNSISQTSDGGFICGGWSISNITGDKKESCRGSEDYWIVKLNQTGGIEWQKTIGGDSSDQLLSIACTPHGGFICGGWSLSGISGDKYENCRGNDDFWIVKLTENYNLIEGKLFADLNSNNMQDSGELSLIGKKLIEPGTNRFAFSDQNGNYSMVVADSGSYSVLPEFTQYYYPSPTTHSATFTGILQTDSLNDFAFQSSGVFNDVCISITPVGAFRSGNNARYNINYGNYGTTSMNAVVYFLPDSFISFVSSDISPSYVSSDSVIWNPGLLSPMQTGKILVTVHINPGLPIGTLIFPMAHIEPLAGDVNPSCNTDSWEVYTTGSNDPNDILVSESTLNTIQLAAQPFLNYIIRFQNTGNDTAFSIKIINPIDTAKLDLSTIEFISSSHPVNIQYMPWGNNMEFKLDNILLPDSNVDEPMSHGFVRYRIKPKTFLPAGDSITNFAAIYFDYNQPVLTNTAVTNIILPSGIFQNPADLQNDMLIYPNPADNSITIQYPKLSVNNGKLFIFDPFGRTVFQSAELNLNSKDERITIDISSFAGGIYFVQLDTGEHLLMTKFVKQ